MKKRYRQGKGTFYVEESDEKANAFLASPPVEEEAAPVGESEKKVEASNNTSYYQGIFEKDCWAYMRKAEEAHEAAFALGGVDAFNYMSAMKYLYRAGHKGSLISDLKKARTYLSEIIKSLENRKISALMLTNDYKEEMENNVRGHFQAVVDSLIRAGEPEATLHTIRKVAASIAFFYTTRGAWYVYEAREVIDIALALDKLPKHEE